MRAVLRRHGRDPRRSVIPLCALIACLCVAVAGCSGSNLAKTPLTTEQKLEDFRYEDVTFAGYDPLPAIKAEVAV